MDKWMVTGDLWKDDDMEKLIQSAIKDRFAVTETEIPTTILVGGT